MKTRTMWILVGLETLILSIMGILDIRKRRRRRKKISKEQDCRYGATVKRLEEVTTACMKQEMDVKEAEAILEKMKEELQKEDIQEPDPREYNVELAED